MLGKPVTLVLYIYIYQEIQLQTHTLCCQVNSRLTKWSQETTPPHFRFKCVIFFWLSPSTRSCKIRPPEIYQAVPRSLHACVNQRDPEAAYALLLEAKEMERHLKAVT